MTSRRPMRILFLHQSFQSLKDGGSGRGNDFARRLAERGHTVTCLAGTFNYLTARVPREFKGRLSVREQLDGYEVLRAWTYEGYHKGFGHRLLTLMSFMLTSIVVGIREPRPDVIAPCTPPFFLGITGYVLSLWHRAPLVYEVRDLWSEVAFQLGIVKNQWVIAAVRKLERFLYSRSRFIVINSPGFIKPLESMGVAADRIRLIPNGVDLDEFRPLPAERERVRSENSWDGKFVVMYAGSLGMANGLNMMLEAAALMREIADVLFVLVGDGQQRAELEASARTRQLTNVQFMGAVPKQRIPELLAGADAGVATLLDIPLFRTTYPNKVFDYMACAKPTLIAIDGVIREVIDASRGGLFVPPQDAAALVDGVRWLRQNPEEASAMGARALSYVREHFDRRNAEVLMANLIDEMNTVPTGGK
jgi:glycosyltransferase involved in cell wall biosynthesis